MKLNVIDTNNVVKNTIELPQQFLESFRPDLITRAVLALQANRRQQYGASPEAGQRYSSYISKRRHNYKTTYGIGQSRTPRKVLNRRGTRFYFVGATAPQTVGGRRAHPPKAEKIWIQKINIKERRKAIRSALAATMLPEIISARGHKIPKEFPFILDSSFESINKTKDLVQTLIKLGFSEEIERASNVGIRAGMGKMRGRKHVTKKSFLFVVSKDCPLLKAATNISGADVVPVDALNAELLAPGTHPGRLTLFTDLAINILEKSNLYTNQKNTGDAQ
ncbi:MAG: 50S ribosomal protein L4 [Candidatus Nanoarchaeia archaeon]|nr:50S ribosomal protein L4 [Candidatus Nanoarchaeia archaeon]